MKLVEDPHNLISNFSHCIFCQKSSLQKCVDPSLNSALKTQGYGYNTLAEELKEFNNIGALKCQRLKKLVNENGENLGMYFKMMEVKWHKACKLTYSKSRLNREKAKATTASEKKPDNISTDTINKFVDWIKKERERKKPFCHFVLSDI